MENENGNRESPFRLFHLTIGVYVPRNAELPETFNDWITRANLCEGASATYLHSVTEINYPLAGDVVERRENATIRPLYN